MPRKRTGQVIEPSGGRSWSIRYTVNKKRYRETLPADSTREDAEKRLEEVLAAITLEQWTPPDEPKESEEASSGTMPTFVEFATDWLRDREPELRPNTRRQYKEDLRHLLPYFAEYELDAITKRLVDDYRRSKLREAERRRKAIASGKPELTKDGQVLRPLSNNSVNRTIQRLGQVLEDAVEADLIEKNPAKGRKRRAKSSKVNRSYLTSDQVQVLLDAAEQLDEDHRQRPQFDAGHRKAMVATLTFAGLRIGELSALKWRDVDLASGKLHVRQSKTDAGVRVVDLAGHVQESLAELKTRTEYAEPEHYVFSTKKGNRTRHSTIRGRVWTETDKDGEVVTKRRGVFHPSVELANRLIEENELHVERLPEDLTPHGLRRTFAGLLFEVGANVPYVMAQMGHEDPRVTLGIYARVVRDQTEVRDRLDQLVRSEKATEKATEPPEPGDKDLVVEAEGR